VTKSELGTKRICIHCNLKFYDLHKKPIVCPSCKTVFEAPAPIASKPQRRLEVSAATVQKPETEKTPATTNSSDELDAATEDKNEEDDCIDEEFEKE
jgi:uncharacterized protein (TIGR02300 family)